jgi:hypothetical protein
MTPNPSIEGMPKRLRLLVTPHVKRYVSRARSGTGCNTPLHSLVVVDTITRCASLTTQRSGTEHSLSAA